MSVAGADKSVRYDVSAVSEKERDRIVSSFHEDISCNSCSATFTENLRASMKRNNVTSVLSEDIDADSSAAPHFRNNVQADIENDTTAPLVDGMLMYILIGAGGLVLVCVTAVVVIRCRRSSDKNPEVDFESAVPIVEMGVNKNYSNPMPKKGRFKKRDQAAVGTLA